MNPAMWVLAGSASVLAGCGDMEYSLDLERLEQSAGIVTDVIIAAPAAAPAETLVETPLPAGAGTADTMTATQDTTAAVYLEQGRKIYTGK